MANERFRDWAMGAAGDAGRREGETGLPRSVPPVAPDSAGWACCMREYRRSATEIVRVMRWSRGDELLVTLQWIVLGANGLWLPLNTPFRPDGASG